MKRHDEPDIHVVALVDQALEPDVRYLAEISIPGLSDSRCPDMLQPAANHQRYRSV